jgi:hypothetical protein
LEAVHWRRFLVGRVDVKLIKRLLLSLVELDPVLRTVLDIYPLGLIQLFLVLKSPFLLKHPYTSSPPVSATSLPDLHQSRHFLVLRITDVYPHRHVKSLIIRCHHALGKGNSVFLLVEGN